MTELSISQPANQPNRPPGGRDRGVGWGWGCQNLTVLCQNSNLNRHSLFVSWGGGVRFPPSLPPSIQIDFYFFTWGRRERKKTGLLSHVKRNLGKEMGAGGKKLSVSKRKRRNSRFFLSVGASFSFPLISCCFFSTRKFSLSPPLLPHFIGNLLKKKPQLKKVQGSKKKCLFFGTPWNLFLNQFFFFRKRMVYIFLRKGGGSWEEEGRRAIV